MENKARILLGLMAFLAVIVLGGCDRKKEVPSASGGGNSTQSVMTVKGAGR